MDRTILHMDLDAFFCSVEIIHNPELKDKAFVVGGKPGSRGVVASASYPARAYGIRSAMPTAQAVRRCPDLIIISSGYHNYQEYSDKVMSLLRESAPVVEQISIDEAFLDVSDEPEGGETLARHLQSEIQSRFGLPTSWGIASSKLVAKIASEIGKPNGFVSVPKGKEAEFLAPLPVDMLWGVGPKSRAVLLENGIKTIGDIAEQSHTSLKNKLGERGLDLAARARGEDPRPVRESERRRSISSERTFAEDVSDPKELARVIRLMSENLGRRLRQKGLAGTTVRIKLRWPDFKTITRQTKLNQPTDQDLEIYEAARTLFSSSWKQGQKVRLIGVGVADLGSPLRQLNLFDQSWEEDERLLKAIDTIRMKYGKKALRRASTLRSTKGTRTSGE